MTDEQIREALGRGHTMRHITQREVEAYRLGVAAERKRCAELEKFIVDMFRLSDWPEGGDVDIFDMQEAAVKRGILIPETRTEPCGKRCHCAEYHGDIKDGVTCYRYSPWLKEHIERGEDA